MAKEIDSGRSVIRARSALLISGVFYVLIAFEFLYMSSPFPWGGAAPLVLGIGTSVAGKRRFQRAGTNVQSFEDPGELVTDGLYGLSRNPMYLGLVLAGFGAALVSATLSAVVLSAAFALTVRYWYIAFEERAMRQHFGERYAAYCRSVGRWLGRRRILR